MPHTSRPCNPPYESRLTEILGDSWSHWSICQSRSHWMTPVDRIEPKPGNPRFFQEIQCRPTAAPALTARRPMIGRNPRAACAMSRPSTEPKPGNRPFSLISPKITIRIAPMSSALTNQRINLKNLLQRLVAKLLLDVARDLVEKQQIMQKCHHCAPPALTVASTINQ